MRSRENSSPRCAITDFKPLCPPADPRARARSCPSGSCTSSTTTSRSATLDLEVAHAARRPPGRCRFMNVSGLTSSDVARPPPSRHQRLGRRRFERDAPRAAPARRPPSKPTLCRVPAYFGAGIAEPDDRSFNRADFFFFFFSSFFSPSSSSFLPFLMTSGSAGVAVGAAAASAGAARFLGLRHDHVDEHRVGVADRLPLRVRSRCRARGCPGAASAR